MIHVGDCLEVMRTLAANSVDAVVTDPPYHLTTGKKGGTGAASVNPNSPAGRARIGTGFMGKAWDGGDIAFRSETWAEALRVAKPGAFLAAFGGTRTFHRLACAIEDAGWDLRDTLMWIYGSGFPKSHNGDWGGTALKPAWEPIILARKPLTGTVEANWRDHGTGALNIDGCRVPIDPDSDASQLRTMERSLRQTGDGWGMSTTAGDSPQVVRPDGRWPANLVHDGSDEVVALFPQSDGQQGDLSGHSKDRISKNAYGDMKAARDAPKRGDSGSAARFFYCAKASKADRDDGLTEFQPQQFGMSGGATASIEAGGEVDTENTLGLNRIKERRNHHPTVKPTELMRWLCRLVTPPGGLILDPFTGSGSTGRGAIAEGFRFAGIELDPDYAAIASARIGASTATRTQDLEDQFDAQRQGVLI